MSAVTLTEMLIVWIRFGLRADLWFCLQTKTEFLSMLKIRLKT